MEAEECEYQTLCRIHNFPGQMLTVHKSDNLKTSGIDVVMAQTLYSIIGAIALHRGGNVANRVTKEKILNPLGLR